MLCAPINAWAEAPFHRATKPIVDSQGRTRVIVDFTNEVYRAYPRDLLIDYDPKRDIQQPQALTQPEPRIFGGTLTEPTLTDPGSNFGKCVDVWAPGDFIYSTWGSGGYATYATGSYSGGQPASYVLGSAPGNPTSPYSGAPQVGFYGWQWLSGTSMAAPHVAAAAAYLADKYYLSTPAAIEQKVRDNWQYWGAVDPTSTIAAPVPVRIVYLPD